MMSVIIDYIICHVILILTLTNSCIGVDSNIDSDYYYGNMVVRSGRVVDVVECDNKFHKKYCLLKCGNNRYQCKNNKCVCAKAYKSSLSRYDLRDDKKISVEEISLENILWPEILGRPIMRHHIAHFCPDLDVARQCIKKCMALGKPAFCGKDHVCYCSHKTTHKQNQDLVNATSSVYSQFKDMYIKYFGPGIFSEEPTTKKPKEAKGNKRGQGGKRGKREKGGKGAKGGKIKTDTEDEDDYETKEDLQDDKSKESKHDDEKKDAEKKDEEETTEGVKGDEEEAKEGEKDSDENAKEDSSDETTEANKEEGGRRKTFIFEY